MGSLSAAADDVRMDPGNVTPMLLARVRSLAVLRADDPVEADVLAMCEGARRFAAGAPFCAEVREVHLGTVRRSTGSTSRSSPGDRSSPPITPPPRGCNTGA